MIQRWAARWDCRLTSGVSDMINDLQWTTLQKSRRLTSFYRSLHQDPPDIQIPQNYIYITPCLTLPVYHTSSISFHLFTTSTNYYQKSFFPHTIADQNNLPDEIIDSTILDDFLYHLKFCEYVWLVAGPNNCIILSDMFLVILWFRGYAVTHPLCCTSCITV